MKKLHVHIAVDNLNDSIKFYALLFGQPASVIKQDYAKWQLDDPAVNFAISHRGHQSGINHLGIQVDSDEELKQIASRLEQADLESISQEGTSCCYAKSNKHWISDPQGIAWESFHTLAEAEIFGEDNQTAIESSACCIPLKQAEEGQGDCCVPNENDVTGCCN